MNNRIAKHLKRIAEEISVGVLDRAYTREQYRRQIRLTKCTRLIYKRMKQVYKAPETVDNLTREMP